MGIEVERKFLLKSWPDAVLDKGRAATIKQGYLVIGQQCELRVRKLGNQFYFTGKRGEGMVREEKEQEIDQPIFDLVWPFTENRRIEKIRYTVKQGNLVFEFDQYVGELDGLKVLEVEFIDVNQARAFVMPGYCEREITGDNRYNNANLALKGRPSG